MCNLQYVARKKTPIDSRLNNQKKDVKDLKAILAEKHFHKRGHTLNKHARFTIVDRLRNTNLDKKFLRKRHIQRENFWIQKI